MNNEQLLFRFRVSLSLFVVGLVLSGVTAFPLLAEMDALAPLLGLERTVPPENYSGVAHWIAVVWHGLADTYEKYPWIAYGTDWLAFGHIVIALFFIPALVNPAASRSNLLVGVWACVLVVPLAWIAGSVRGIPIYWRCIDCCFGVFGIIPLVYCLRLLNRMRSRIA